MKPKWQSLASLAQGICTLQCQFFGAVFASKGYPFKNIFGIEIMQQISKVFPVNSRIYYFSNKNVLKYKVHILHTGYPRCADFNNGFGLLIYLLIQKSSSS